ncbi:hypothetical protein W97_02757 [Coniosporium apollinis CBS 100218]|uniref:Cytochrome b561 domain-containing protein n=1 Tax=Coniosporium apollinis (strain CBS 100218) TaxID=1168221 RepID=R7YNY2_CONA1|nr:uncharacterized protein W97_02757 [Coniosporium apollinis CBS 100218]EON63529.1 hypothetical protein W97_02757 [Coniosporium apollinis CBS 100218]
MRAQAAALLGFASAAYAQVATTCPQDGVCFGLNIPENTASSGSGDIFFQISAPTTYSWVALGQGSGMSGSNIFVIYTSASGNNVTLSPRLGQGYRMPNYNSAAQVTLLEGSGVTDGVMTANVKCSNCNSWNGGDMDFTSSSGGWIWANQQGSPLNSDDTSESIVQHRSQGGFAFDFSTAKGGNGVNPFANSGVTVASASAGSTASCTPRPRTSSATQTTGPSAVTAASTAWPSAFPSDGEMQRRRNMLIAHGVLASLAFVIFFPAGAISIRVFSFPGLVWFHAAMQAFAYLVYIVAFGLGVYIATTMRLIDAYHPVIGIVLFIFLFFQPILGLLHHAMFKKYKRRTFWSYAHLWLGRIIITLGIINGGLGLLLANNSPSGAIAYGVIAAIVWLVYVAAAVYGEMKKARSAPPKYSERMGSDEGSPMRDMSGQPREYYGTPK